MMRHVMSMASFTYAYFDAFGEPEQALRLGEAPIREPGAGELCVQMLAAPVNPADINYIQGVYGEKPGLPGARAGLEGAGIVLQSRVPGFAEGDHVLLLCGAGSWAGRLTAPAKRFLKLPQNLDPLQAAMLKINPLAAYLALTKFRRLKPGDWVAQNAANSGAGQCLIQLAHAMGLHTINLVRRAEERSAALKALGADVVVEDGDPDAAQTALAQAGGVRPALACNCVGGDSATKLMDMLAPGGVMATYGSMSRKSVKVPNKWLIFKDITLHGLWCAPWLQTTPRDQIETVYGQLAAAVADGRLVQTAEAVYPLRQVWQAVAHARREGRKGKVLLKLCE